MGMIRFADWNIEASAGLFARQYDHLTRRIEVQGDLPEGWEWAVLVQVGDALDIISLQETESGVGTVLTADQLSVGDAWYHLQLRGTKDGEVRHTNVIRVYVPAGLSGSGRWPELPSEFTQAEQRIRELNSHPPVPGDAGFWMVWDPDAGCYTQSKFPLPAGGGSGVNGVSPVVTLAETATGVDISVTDAEGTKIAAVKHGRDGIAPHIGANGNWWLGDEDTGVSASGGGSDGGDDAAEWELLVNHTVTAEEAEVVQITFTQESYPLINGQKALAMYINKPEGKGGWFNLKAGSAQVIDFDGGNNTVQRGFAEVVKGYWRQNRAEGSNLYAQNYFSPAYVATYQNKPSNNPKYVEYTQLTLSSYQAIWPAGTTIIIYGQK